MAFHRTFGRDDVPLVQLEQGTGRRWASEEGFQRAKEIGLDQYEARSWQGWHRHITLCLLAHVFLTVTRVAGSGEKGRAEVGVLPVTTPEIRRLLALLFGEAAERPFHLHWARWRRRRQAEARRNPYKRRLRLFTPEVPLSY